MPTSAPHLATPAELEAALEIWRRANTARGKTPGPQRIARVREKLADPRALVMVSGAGEAITAMALAEPGHGAVDLCHLSMIFVDPGLWGTGIGARLLGGVIGEAAARGWPRVQVWTGVTNHRAQRLYAGAGFAATGQMRHLASGEQIVHLLRDDGRVGLYAGFCAGT